MLQEIDSQLISPVTTIDLFLLELPLVHPFTTSFGTQTKKRAIIVKVGDEHGNNGWGETSVMNSPSYCYETEKTAWHIQNDFLIPILRDVMASKGQISIKRVLKEWEQIRGHEFAKAGIESAMWALKAEQENVSLGTIYGSTKTEIPTGVSIGIPKNPDDLLARVNQFLEQGYKRIKIKIKPGWDVEPVRAIRNEYGDIPLMVDANSAYSLSEKHVKLLQELDSYDLMMIEQPLAHDDILEHCKLQKMMNTPICLDESIHTVSQARLALENDCCRLINIKPGRVGGYLNAIQIARENPGKVWCGGMLETGIGRMHNIFLQARPEFHIPGDTSGSNRYFNPDIIDPEVQVRKDGFIEVPTTKGLGVTVKEDYIKKNTIKSIHIRLND